MTGGPNHTHGLGPERHQQRRALAIALVANGGFLVVEVVGGLAFRSLALLADAAHLLSDVAGLSISLVAQRLLLRPATAKHSYGMQRAEVVGGQLNAFILMSLAGWVVYEAIRRIGQPVDVAGGGMLVVATLGLLVNVACALVLSGPEAAASTCAAPTCTWWSMPARRSAPWWRRSPSCSGRQAGPTRRCRCSSPAW